MCSLRLEGNLPEEFSLSGKNVRCPDFVKDITLGERTQQEEKKEEVRR